jgi:hypothetical protein
MFLVDKSSHCTILVPLSNVILINKCVGKAHSIENSEVISGGYLMSIQHCLVLLPTSFQVKVLLVSEVISS